jgi:carotenoid cleavage dioxygenase-like enzyme
MNNHLDMDQLIAVRDGDRSEPGLAMAQQHFGSCALCQSELERLHQRTARLRALPALSPATDEFPALHLRVVGARRQRHWRIAASTGLALAAAAVALVITHDLVQPTRLNATEQIRTEISRSQQLEHQLHQWHPEQRVVDGRTAMVVIQLEDRIAALDAQLAADQRRQGGEAAQRQLVLWQQRVGLMNALVSAHLTNASSMGL